MTTSAREQHQLTSGSPHLEGPPIPGNHDFLSAWHCSRVLPPRLVSGLMAGGTTAGGGATGGVVAAGGWPAVVGGVGVLFGMGPRSLTQGSELALRPVSLLRCYSPHLSSLVVSSGRVSLALVWRHLPQSLPRQPRQKRRIACSQVDCS
ncbi:MAG: hypothetical protein NTY08_16070 [Proteobacteria bacterium]|nr:hypothetical protein [Pseudomonadota bacterium]